MCFDRNNEDVNSEKSTDTGDEDAVGKEIIPNIAKVIGYLMTNRQPDYRFRPMYHATHHPANVPALEEVQVNSSGKREGSELEEEIAYAQNCMLKGVTKTAYVMDNLFKHVEKIPKELQPRQLMSDLTSAMKFFGAANLEFIRIRERSLNQSLKYPGGKHTEATSEYENILTERKIRRHGESRFHLYNKEPYK